MSISFHRAVLLAATLWHATAGSLWGAQPPGQELPNVLQTYAHDLAAVTDDTQALELFRSHVGAALDLKEAVGILTARSSPAEKPMASSPKANPEASKQATDLVKELAAWRLALGLLAAAETGPGTVENPLPEAEGQLHWLTSDSQRPYLRETWSLASTIAAIPRPEPGQPAMSPEYQVYAGLVDQTYPRLTGPENAWLAIAEREGAEGVLTRLASVGEERTTPPGRQAFAIRYFAERLRPALSAHLVAFAIRAEAEAERRAQDLWLRLRTLADSLREQRGLARLCGTWQWTVHNHLNHAEHKMIMSFPPPGADPGPGIRPARILVAGDTVYLRWEFERGIVQEDSLLFSGEGQRMEGTFTNSAGPWGGITAKRMSACGPAGTADQGTPPGRGKPAPHQGR
jgi:hypothetical protein